MENTLTPERIRDRQYGSMTPDEMDRDLEEMRSHLAGVSLDVERCRHHSTTRTALWAFDKNGRQIASVSRLQTSSKYAWEASKIRDAMPITRLSFETLSEAAAYVLRCC